MPMSEVWKDVPEWPYAVSNLGRIKRTLTRGRAKAGKEIKPFPDGNGYRVVCLRDMGRRWDVHVHILVAAAFLGPRPNGWEVDHLDGDKWNARQDNLEYTTVSENRKRAYRLGLNVAPKGEDSQIFKYYHKPRQLAGGAYPNL